MQHIRRAPWHPFRDFRDNAKKTSEEEMMEKCISYLIQERDCGTCVDRVLWRDRMLRCHCLSVLTTELALTSVARYMLLFFRKSKSERQ